MKTLYRMYLWSFRGTQEVFAVSERIVEYPFAIKVLKDLPAQSRVMLVGCHGDLLGSILAALNLRVFGVDVKDFPFVFENFSFYKQDVRTLKFEENYFDAAVAISTIEHVGLFDNDPSGDRRAIREIARVLKPRGLVVLSVPFGSTHVEIAMRQRIYSAHSLAELLEDLETTSISTYVYSPSRLWTEVAVAQVPQPGRYTTHCTAIVCARKPRSS